MINGVKSWFGYIKMLMCIMKRRQKVLWLFLFALVLVSSAFQLVCVYAISPLVSSMTNKEVFMESRVVSIISSFFKTSEYTSLFCELCFVIAFLYFVKALLEVFRSWFSIKFAQNVQRELAGVVLESYMRREYDFFLGYGTAKVMRDVKEDTQSVHNILTYVTNLLAEFVTICLLMVYIVASDLHFAICMGALAVLSLIVMFLGIKRTLLKAGVEARIRAAENQKVLLESIEGVKEVQVMKKQGYFVNAFHKSLIFAQKPAVFQYLAATTPTSIVEGIFVIGIMIFLCIKAMTDTQFWDKLPMLASFLVAAVRMLPSMGRITNNLNNMQFCIPALFSVYDNVQRIRQSDSGIMNGVDQDNGQEATFKDVLELEDITYHYHDSDKNVLDGLCLTISKGESVGIIGHSGAGKSTLADIILGLHIPQNGAVKLDDVDIREIPYEYSRVIGYVPQNVYLVDGTIRENVAFGVDANNIDEDYVIKVLKQAKLYDFVMNTENGLDTIIGERGVKFSGGQRQRLAIARALYRKPQILILDEATSALDNETEAAVMEQVEEMQGTITLIIIAHRLSTIEKCDTVYEIVDGKAFKQER